jgi:hypothetical protein
VSALRIEELRPDLYRTEELDGGRLLAEHVVAGE